MLKKGIKKLLSVSLLEILRLKLNMRLLLKLLKLRKLGLYIIEFENGTTKKLKYYHYAQMLFFLLEH